MKPIGIGLAIALIMGVLAPASAFAAAPAKPDANEAAKKAGMADAPALITQTALPCQLADARLVGTNTDKNKVTTKFYEVACTGSLGYVILAKGDGSAPDVFDCLATAAPGPDGKPSSLACKLPGNANPAPGLQPLLTAAGSSCVADKAKYIGQSPKTVYYEVACQNGAGAVIAQNLPRVAGAKPELLSCLAWSAAGKKCELTTDEANMAPAKALVAKSGKACTVKDQRYILTAKDGSDYYEFACTDGSGFVIQANAAGAFVKTIDCANASYVGGGCTLTDARAAETEQADLYTRLAKKAGFNCTVAKYALFPTSNAQREIIEMQCSNRPDGAVAIFPSSATEQAQVFDCVRSQVEGYRCSFSKPEAAYPAIAAQLKGFKKSYDCNVSNAMARGVAGDSELVEVSCGAGQGRLILEYLKGKSALNNVLTCGEINGGCKLPQ